MKTKMSSYTQIFNKVFKVIDDHDYEALHYQFDCLSPKEKPWTMKKGGICFRNFYRFNEQFYYRCVDDWEKETWNYNINYHSLFLPIFEIKSGKQVISEAIETEYFTKRGLYFGAYIQSIATMFQKDLNCKFNGWYFGFESKKNPDGLIFKNKNGKEFHFQTKASTYICGSCDKEHFDLFETRSTICSLCGFPPLFTKKYLKKCGICKSEIYCSKLCQEMDWKNHKKKCTKMIKKTISN